VAQPKRQPRKPADLTDYLQQRVHFGDLIIPIAVSLEADDSVIVSTLYSGSQWPKRESPPPGLAFRFCRLSEAPPVQVRNFAATYGVLGPSAAAFFGHRTPRPRSAKTWTEPVRLWHKAASMTRALGRLAAALREREPGAASDWAIASAREATPIDSRHLSVAERRELFLHLLDQWCEVARPTERSEWLKGDGPSTRVEGAAAQSSLLCAVTHELRLAANSEKGLVICTSCHYAYYPPRMVPIGQPRKFCDEEDCGLRGAWRMAKQLGPTGPTTATGGQKGALDG